MSIRVERVAKKIKFLLATALQRELSDPRMGFVTVVRCDLSADFRHCKVHVSILADTEGEVSKVMHMLQDARGFLQRYVAQNLETRATPHLEIMLDKGAQHSVEISSLLDDLRRERQEREGPEDDDEGEDEDDADDDTSSEDDSEA